MRAFPLSRLKGFGIREEDLTSDRVNAIIRQRLNQL
ncbi:uncharacterized protein G2W53_015527 [Senna tora]|uniref:Uncharacterized protein n=1 Tax=Senna tora TaxID=362788 RepID=A0A834WVS9_9FABA|nr:uncharacterized protein G2W53_015527 [Senna tora]